MINDFTKEKGFTVKPNYYYSLNELFEKANKALNKEARIEDFLETHSYLKERTNNNELPSLIETGNDLFAEGSVALMALSFIDVDFEVSIMSMYFNMFDNSKEAFEALGFKVELVDDDKEGEIFDED